MSLSGLASILVNIILPIVLVAGAGCILARTLDVDTRPLSRVMLDFFTPALIFNSAYRAELSREYVTIGVFAVVITALMGVVTWVLIRVMHYDR
ncbi:MAG TPA: hypothetical protein VF478_01650, partial [Anaerolineae bacterium]